MSVAPLMPWRTGQRLEAGAVACGEVAWVRRCYRKWSRCCACCHDRIAGPTRTYQPVPRRSLTHARHRRCRSYGAILTRSATRPRLVAAVGASSRGVAQALFPAIQPRPAGPRYPASNLGNHPRPWPRWRMCAGRRGDRVELTIGPRQLRGGVAAAEASPARPTHGGSRSFERGCTGRAGRCSRPRRRFGFRRRRAPSVRRRWRGVGHCA